MAEDAGVTEERLLDLAYDAIFVIDAETHRIGYWNRGAERMYGFPSAEAIGSVSHQLLQTGYAAGRLDAYERVARIGHWEGRLVQTRKDGVRLLVDGRWAFDPASGRILEINRDVSEQVAEQERFALLVSSVKDYAIFLLDTEGKVATWNEGARAIKGYEAEEIIVRHFSAFYSPADLAAGKPDRGLRQARDTGRFEDEGWRIRKDGNRFWADVVITALHDPAGRLTGYAKVTRDVSERQLQRRRLEELERSKTTFLNLAAHELRGPLSVLRGYISMLASGQGLDRAVIDEKVLPALTAKTEEMTRLVEQMVEVARLEEGSLVLRLERLDLGTVVEKSVQLTEQLTDVTHPLVLQPAAEELVVEADAERVATILGNLLGNAIKYSPNGGTITVQVAVEGAHAKVAVSDQGVGIPDDQRERLFGRFARLQAPATRHIGGTGLGLYLSRELARMHGGDLLLEHSGDQGSRFALVLPLA